MQSKDSQEAKDIVDAFIAAYMEIAVHSALTKQNRQLSLRQEARGTCAAEISD